MIRSTVQSIVVALAVVSTVGCQSMSRMAWWKGDAKTSPTAVAKATAPALPSTQAKPQAIAAAGIEPATPPSSANLAAARTTAPASSTAGTTAPLASAAAPPVYPSTGAAAPAYPVTSASTAALAPATPAASIAQAGPYDPNGYRPTAPNVASPGSSTDVADRYGIPQAAPGADRYGFTPSANLQAPTTPISGAIASAPGAATASPIAAAGDRYSMPPTADSGSRYGSLPIAAAAPPATMGGTLQANSAPAAVQLTPAAGQYRPGGTSNYGSSATGDHVEVATRPTTSLPTQMNPDPAMPTGYPPLPESAAPGSVLRPY